MNGPRIGNPPPAVQNPALTSQTPASQNPATPASSNATPQASQNQFEVTAGKAASVATALGAPAEVASKVTAESAKLVRGFADTAKANMINTYVQGGEAALQQTGAAKAAMNLEAAAQRTAGTASKVAKVGTALNVAGAGLAAVDQFQNSSAQTTAGKVVSSTGAGATAYALGISNPYLAAADAAAGLVGAPDTFSNVVNKSIDTLTTVGEAAITQDTRGLENLHQRNRSGQNGAVFQTAAGAGEQFSGYIDAATTGDTRALDNLHKDNLQGKNGVVFQAAAEAGDYWADKGIIGGLSEGASALGWLIWGD